MNLLTLMRYSETITITGNFNHDIYIYREAVTDLIVTCYYVTYVIVTSDQYLFVFLLYPCELSVLFFIRCKIRVLVACQVHERIDLKDRYDY